MARLLLNGKDVLGLVCSFAVQSAIVYVNQACTCKTFNNVLKKNITALCAGITFNLDRIASEHRKAEMYKHITLRTPISPEPFSIKSIKFIAGYYARDWRSCERIPFGQVLSLSKDSITSSKHNCS